MLYERQINKWKKRGLRKKIMADNTVKNDEKKTKEKKYNGPKTMALVSTRTPVLSKSVYWLNTTFLSSNIDTNSILIGHLSCEQKNGFWIPLVNIHYL